MTFENALFTSKNIYFAPIDHEKDAKIVSGWTHDPVYLRGNLGTVPQPLPEAKVKKQFETLEKSVEKGGRFYFMARAIQDDHLIGYGDIDRISWSNQCAWLSLGIGAEKDRGQGYGTEILDLLVQYAFDELNLYRLIAAASEDNSAALALFKKAGFIEEVRQRERIYHDGQRWDLIHFGLLQEQR